MLQNDGDSVQVLDFSAESYDEQKLITAVQQADVIGMSVLSSSLTEVKKLIQLIKQHEPDLPVIIGGPHCTLLPEKSLEETEATIGVQGDCETLLTDLKKALNNEKDFSEIPGVFHQSIHGIKHGPAPQLMKDLDNIPFPARQLVKHYTYGREYNPHLKAGEFTSIITSRGITMQRYRTRST